MADDILRGLRAAIGFLTTLPVSIREGDYDCFADRQYLVVPAAILIGVILGASGTVLQWLLPPSFVGILVIVTLFLITGINHMDGLTDMGDGLVTSGSREKKIAAMKDVHVGAGGLLFMAMDLLFLYALISTFAGSPMPLFIPLLVAEVCAKVAMAVIIAFGESTHQGMGSYMIERANRKHSMISVIGAWMVIIAMMLVAAWLWNGGSSIQVMIACGTVMLSPLVTALAMLAIADRNFGGVNGDVIGATNEIARILALCVMGVVLWTHF
ncbi:MAG TPA: adenosylcobinamide-GDP ribazoletransferase [Methanocella sp.]|nr:adenosylcobinamide-GDP ribazoletransferase [Methanocella sp.]